MHKHARTLTLRTLLTATALCAVTIPAVAQSSTAAPARTVVESSAELPRFAYKLDVKPSRLLIDDAAADALLTRLSKDAADVFANYDIRDRQGRDLFRSVLREKALADGKWDDVIRLSDEIRADIEKPAEKATSGLMIRAYVAAEKAGGDAAARRKTFRAMLDRQLADLPADLVLDRIKATKAQLDTFNPDVVKGSIEAQLDKVHAANPEMGFEFVAAILSTRSTLRLMEAYGDEAKQAVGAWLVARTPAPGDQKDIWAAREIVLPESAPLAPVVVAIWDSGVDVGQFTGRLFVNAKEKPGTVDSDRNGFVGDVNGIAFGLKYEKSTGLLNPLAADLSARAPQMLDVVKGSLDLRSGIESPEAQALKSKMASMKREEVGPFVEDSSTFGNYIHGTAVASIAARGNPAIRLLPVRNHWPTSLIPPAMDEAYADAMVTAAKDTVAYLKANNVRVVNMSWRVSRPMIEATLAVNNIEPDPKARAERADRIFKRMQIGLTEAFKSAPGILFIAGAGNEDQDIGFAGSVPAGIQLPNLVTVGAVDKAGRETSFTSVGKAVTLHADGFEVDSVVPGGAVLKLSGTSMAAPQVTNLAAKLFAAQPSLTADKVLALIRQGADAPTDRGVALINPKRTFELASKRN